MKKGFIYRFKYLLIFAIILLMVALDFVIYRKVLNKQVGEAVMQHYDAIQNSSYQRKPVTLYGDVTAILNANSNLKINKDSPLLKNIVLDGDAFFMIPPGQKDSVFIYTRMLKIGTTGAAFRITAHQESAGQTLEMLSGKSLVAKAYPSSFPEPEYPVAGNMVMINKDIDLMELEKFDTAGLKTWLADSLIFDREDLSQAVKKLENWFDLDFDVSGKVPETLNINAQFHQAGLRAILDELSKQYKFSYRIQGNAVSITF